MRTPGPGEIHLWQAPLDGDAEPFLEWLSDDERSRAQRFAFERDSRLFTAARGRLRGLLSRYLGIPAGRLEFRYGPHGKPFLESGPRFNLSHSGGMGLFAFCTEEIGVDIELIREMSDAEGILSRYFAPSAAQRWREASPHERPRIFFDCWTRQEALAKASGEGLTAIARIVAEEWSLFDVSPEPQYAAALAVRAGEWRIESFSLSEAEDSLRLKAVPSPT